MVNGSTRAHGPRIRKYKGPRERERGRGEGFLLRRDVRLAWKMTGAFVMHENFARTYKHASAHALLGQRVTEFLEKCPFRWLIVPSPVWPCLRIRAGRRRGVRCREKGGLCDEHELEWVYTQYIGFVRPSEESFSPGLMRVRAARIHSGFVSGSRACADINWEWPVESRRSPHYISRGECVNAGSLDIFWK